MYRVHAQPAQPTFSLGLVMVSAKAVVRPHNFGAEKPLKSQKDEKTIGGPNFYGRLDPETQPHCTYINTVAVYSNTNTRVWH